MVEDINLDEAKEMFWKKCSFETFDQLGEFVFEDYDIIGCLGRKSQNTPQKGEAIAVDSREIERLID